MVAVYGPAGELIGVTYKVHPVLAAGEAWGGSTPKIYPTFTTTFGQLGAIICFDHDFPNGSARLQTLTGSQILAVPSWDWGSISSVRWQSVVFRSVENRIPIVKGEAGFDSTITDANGSVLERTAVKNSNGEQAILVQNVHLSPRTAPFTTLGGLWFGVLVLLAALSRYVWQFIAWRREKKMKDEGWTDDPVTTQLLPPDCR
jgi:predicted amidohydrolase